MAQTDLSQMELKNLLKTHFGFNDFLPGQENIIKNVLAQKDTIAIMPTGGGKSLCYQLPALILEGITIVISPLIALMKDQVDALNANGIDAAYLNSSLESEEQQDILHQLKINEIKLLYIAPESLFQLNPIIESIKIGLIAVDEAHCISAWGHDFRPAYQKLGHLKTQFENTPIIALTATADKATRKDIATQLNIQKAKVFLSSFDRPNLFLDIRSGQKRKQQIFRFLGTHRHESGIIYCLSRKSTEKLAQNLRDKGHKAKAYHAGMSSKDRSQVQEDFINDKTTIVVATIAFGMGIDKSNVRFVIHYNMPKNIEGYYQEIGRAGRDGLPADTILFYSYGDIILLRKFIDESANQEFQLAKLERMQQYAQSFNCRRRMLLSYFGEHIEKDCGHCDNCQNPIEYFDGTVIAQKICSAIARVQEKVGLNTLIDILRGAQNAQVIDNGYQNIKTYGAAKNISWHQLKDYIIQLINKGIIEIWFHENGRLVLTPLAKKILFKDEKIKLANQTEFDHNNQAQALPESNQTGQLFELLKQKRTELAQQAQMPPYVIFSDASLKDMENRLPTTETEFSDIVGVGKKKLEQYADTFLQIINQYIQEHPAKYKDHSFIFGTTQNKRKKRSGSKSRKDLWEKLFDLREKIAEKRGVSAEKICTENDINLLDKVKPRVETEFNQIDFSTNLKPHINLFLKCINRHCDSLERKLPSEERSYKLYLEENMSVSEIALRRGVTENTIVGHFIKMHKKGNPFDFSKIISAQNIQNIEQAKQKLKNPEGLKSYYKYFDSKIPYWKIKLGLYLSSK